MKFNPFNKKLYTDNWIFIKQFHCPYGIKWNDLEVEQSNKASRFCSICDDNVYDTDGLLDKEILKMAKEKEGICFKISKKQKNIEVVFHNV